jgi:hypothetical protein
LGFEVEVVTILRVKGRTLDVLHEMVDVVGVNKCTVGFDKKWMGDELTYF